MTDEIDTTTTENAGEAPITPPAPTLLTQNADGTYNIPEELVLRERVHTLEGELADAKDKVIRLSIVHDALNNTIASLRAALEQREQTIADLNVLVGAMGETPTKPKAAAPAGQRRRRS